MKCPECGLEGTHHGESETMVGYLILGAHHHNDNCLKRHYRCPAGHTWVESLRRTCNVEGCDWKGKEACWCHAGPKVEQWSAQP